MGGRSLLQGIFPTQGSNPGLLHCRQSLNCLGHQGSWGKYEDIAIGGIHSKGEGKPGFLAIRGALLWD